MPDGLRTAENRRSHEKGVKEQGHPILWTYSLLIATPNPLAPGEKVGLPQIKISAAERSGTIGSTIADKPGDLARLRTLIRPDVPQKSKQVTISGQKFLRSDFEWPRSKYHDGSFETMFETVSDSYLIEFDFRAASEKELKELVKTMDTLKFDAPQ